MKKILFLIIFVNTFLWSENGAISGSSPTYISIGGKFYKRTSLNSTTNEYVYGELNGANGWIAPPYYVIYPDNGYGVITVKEVTNLPATNGIWYYRLANNYSYTKLVTLDCVSPSTLVNGECVAPVITCGANMTLNSAKTACVCNGGYKPDDVTYDTAGNITTINTCKPFKNCPPQMKYFWTDKATTIIGTQTDYAGCIPRTDLSEADCGAQGGTYYKWANDMSDGTSQQAKYMMSRAELNSAVFS